MAIELTRAEGITFLTDVLDLNVPSKVLSCEQQPDLTFLNCIIRAFMENIPFQSVTLIAEDLDKRHVPTWPEVKSAMFQKHGGVCHSLNGFMFFLLKSLGYDVTLGFATVTVSPYPAHADHVIIFVRNLVKTDDTYLVDVGFGNPSFEAVCLDFDFESPVFRHSYLEFKFFKRNGEIIRAHGKGDPRFTKDPEPWENVIDSWRGAYEFTTGNMRSFDKFHSFYQQTYTNLDDMSFHRSLRALSYPKGKALGILHENILCEGDGVLLEKTHLSDDDAVVDAYHTYFPQFDECTVRRAVSTWRKQLQALT